MKRMLIPALLSLFLVSSPCLYANDSEFSLEQIDALLEQDKQVQAQELISKWLKKDSNNADALFYQGKIYAIQDKLDDAEKVIEKALKLAPNNAALQAFSGDLFGRLAQKASIFSALGYAKNSLKGYEKAVALAPDNLFYRLGLFRYHVFAPGIAGGDKEVAMAQAKAIAELDKKQGYIAEAEVYLATEKVEQLLQHFSNTPDNIANDVDVLFSKGMIYQQVEKLADSENALKQVIALTVDDKLNTTRLSALYQLGKLSGQRNANLEQGVAALEEFIATENRPKHLPDDLWAQFRLANLWALQGFADKATESYKSIKNKTTDDRLKREIKKLL